MLTAIFLPIILALGVNFMEKKEEQKPRDFANGKWLRGARIWAQKYPFLPNKIDLFEYRGYDELRRLHIFVARKGGIVMWKTDYQLNTDTTFYPFLLNTNFMEVK